MGMVYALAMRCTEFDSPQVHTDSLLPDSLNTPQQGDVMVNRAENRKFHYIYKITRNDGSGKYYIGMHSTDDLEDGYFGSGVLLASSIMKHGKEKHLKEILEFLPSRSELKTRERELVNEEIVNDVLCMNLKLGGEGGGKFSSKEHQQKCSSAGGKNGGKAALQKINRDPAVRAKITKTRQKNGSLATFGMLNKTHSTEAKMRMSIAGSGEKNSQYGSCWVTDGVKPMKIRKEQLEEYLVNGYSRGRK